VKPLQEFHGFIHKDKASVSEAVIRYRAERVGIGLAARGHTCKVNSDVEFLYKISPPAMFTSPEYHAVILSDFAPSLTNPCQGWKDNWGHRQGLPSIMG
jgi:hypothetical protein